MLLRIEFTASNCLQPTSELLPHFSTLTASMQAPYRSLCRKRRSLRISLHLLLRLQRAAVGFVTRRYLSVALVRGSPLAGVTRYPCPGEPGLSSRTAFRLVPAAARPARPTILPIRPVIVKRKKIYFRKGKTFFVSPFRFMQSMFHGLHKKIEITGRE